MFVHEGKRTDRSTATAPRAARGVFVGIADTCAAYLMYDLDRCKIFKVGDAKFNPHVFPLKQMLLAGQPVHPTTSVDPDGWRRTALLHPDKATNTELVEFCCGTQLVLEAPRYFFPEYPAAWTLECHRPETSKQQLHLVAIFQRYHGDERRLPKDMRNYATRPKDTAIEISPPSSGKDFSLRHLLALTYPSCTTLSEMAAASVQKRGMYPIHPAVHLAHASLTHSTLFCQCESAKDNPALWPAVHTYAAELRQAQRIFPLTLPPKVIRQGQSLKLGFEPRTRREAMQHVTKERWLQAERDECAGWHKRGIVQAVPLSSLPRGTQILRHQWVYSDKDTGPKARCCLRGDAQFPSPPPSETYASTPSAASLRLFIGHAEQHGRKLRKCDITQAFCQSHPFKSDVHLYMYPPAGQAPPGVVWRVLGPLYGMAAASAAWSATAVKYLLSDGWKPLIAGEENIFKKTIMPAELDFDNSHQPDHHSSDRDLIAIIHVDDVGVSAHPCCDTACEAFFNRFLTRFEGKDLGIMTRYVGIDVHRVPGCTYLTQSSFIHDLVDDLGLTDCNPVICAMEPGTRLLDSDQPAVHDFALTAEYQHIVGCLQYLNQWTRPGLSFVTKELSRHQSNPGEIHMEAAKKAVRYLKGTPNYGLVYRKSTNGDKLVGYADADWAGDTETRKSVSANVFTCNGAAVLWHCKQQQGVATSTAEAEFVAASQAAKDATWLRRIMSGYGMHQYGPTPIYEDNMACSLMSEHPVASSRTRHIDVAVHNVRHLVRNNTVRLLECPTHDMAADVFTKALPAPAFCRHRDTILGYIPSSAPPLPVRIPDWREY